jgi:methylmalonyl-CoA/ethylmalonyl-CoA epimerase
VINSKFNHLGVAVSELPSSIAFFEQFLGYHLIRGPYDDPIQKVSVCFMGREQEHPVIELVAPGAENSPLASYLKRGIGGYHVCYEVPDLAESIRSAEQQGCIVIGEPVPAVAFDNRKVCWLFTPTRLLIELLAQSS